mmetsp:Transcript_19890/g.76218  ORF Transcript_19890/g.76218 Transcript_19890/m.76218 type:complete len:115 (+) Transcript_19890:710-1054(+)
MRMMVRHDAYNRLLAAFSPGHIRLSIHTTANKDNKYCVNLLDNGEQNQKVTPWHGALVDHRSAACQTLPPGAPGWQQGLEIMTKAEAEKRSYTCTCEGNPPLQFFRVPEATATS